MFEHININTLGILAAIGLVLVLIGLFLYRPKPEPSNKLDDALKIARERAFPDEYGGYCILRFYLTSEQDEALRSNGWRIDNKVWLISPKKWKRDQ